MWWYLISGILAATVVAGIIYITIKGMITKKKLRAVMEKKNIQGMMVKMADSSRNKVRLADLNSDTVIEVKGDGIADDIREGRTVRTGMFGRSAELRALEKECTNRTSLAELNRLEEEGNTHVMAAMDNRGNIVGDVDLIKDTAHDSQLHALHNRTGEGVIVIED